MLNFKVQYFPNGQAKPIFVLQPLILRTLFVWLPSKLEFKSSCKEWSQFLIQRL